MNATLKDYGVLVTGGGTGIGHACAAALVADGAAVTICGRTEATLVDSAERLKDKIANGGSVQYAICDVTDEDSVASVASTP